jgi:5'-3' exonuclease
MNFGHRCLISTILVTGFGITQFAVEGFEADDIIATLATRAETRRF